MELKILEHCCYRKYLNNWYSESRGEWTLIHYGDHLMVELIDWCVNMCYCEDGVEVTVAIPRITEQTRQWLEKNKSIRHLNIITQDDAPDLHTQIVTISSITKVNGTPRECFVLQGGLLQNVCPGKYVTQMGIGIKSYEAIQPLLKSWLRLYKSLTKPSQREGC